MKKIFLIFFVLLFFINISQGRILPRSKNALNHWGIGVLRIANEITIYEKNDKNSKIVETIYWDNLGNFKSKTQNTKKDTFAYFIPERNFAFLTVEDEDDKWVEVCYNQKYKKFGYVFKDKDSKFIPWKDFLLQYGKKYGIILFTDEFIGDKKLYAQGDETSKVVDNFDYPKHIMPWFVNGNWLLVKLYDYDDEQKTGYIRWRNDDGSLRVFIKAK